MKRREMLGRELHRLNDRAAAFVVNLLNQFAANLNAYANRKEPLPCACCGAAVPRIVLVEGCCPECIERIQEREELTLTAPAATIGPQGGSADGPTGATPTRLPQPQADAGASASDSGGTD